MDYDSRWTKRANGSNSGDQNDVSRSVLFNDANNFVIRDSNLYSIANIQLDNSSAALEKLANHTIRGAEFDSSARDPPPQCHPGTRASVIGRIEVWLYANGQEKKLLWLSGPAGVGKSAVVQTLAESLSKSRLLGASLFFSGPNQRNDPQRVFITIAFQLAVRIVDYRAYINDRLVEIPNLLDKNIEEQFRILIIEPFGRRRMCQGDPARAILLDGLDECRGEEAQCKIIELIGGFVSEFPTAPLIWLIASRPEPKLQNTFSLNTLMENLWREYLPVDSTEACQDVERLLNSGFERIRRQYPYSIPSSPRWPNETDLLKIAKTASGLFIYAATIIRFVEDADYADPVSQLQIVLAVIDHKYSNSPDQQNPFFPLDALYTEVLRRIPNTTFSTTRRILGYLLLPRFLPSLSPTAYHVRGAPNSLKYVSNVLGLQQNVVYAALQKLHSLFAVPPPETATTKMITFYHASFADYLQDPTRSGEFTIDPSEATADRCRCCSRILRQVSLSSHLPPSLLSLENISLSWPFPDSAKPLTEDNRWRTIFVQHLYLQARHEFTQFLTMGCTDKPTPDPFVTLTESQSLDLLSEVDFSKLGTVYFRSNTDIDFFNFVGWVFKLWKACSPTLRSRGILQAISLQELDVEAVVSKENIFPWVLYHWIDEGQEFAFDLKRPRTLQDMKELLPKLQELQQNYPQTDVLVCGRDASKRGALFAVPETNYDYSCFEERAYYYFPM